MKPIILYIFLLVLFTHSATAQVFTYKELTGTWDKQTSNGQKLYFQFLDSSKVKIITSKGVVSMSTYKLDTTGKGVKMSIESSFEGITLTNNYYVRLLNEATLRMENANPYDPVVQTRPYRTYLILKKRKALKEKEI